MDLLIAGVGLLVFIAQLLLAWWFISKLNAIAASLQAIQKDGAQTCKNSQRLFAIAVVWATRSGFTQEEIDEYRWEDSSS